MGLAERVLGGLGLCLGLASILMVSLYLVPTLRSETATEKDRASMWLLCAIVVGLWAATSAMWAYQRFCKRVTFTTVTSGEDAALDDGGGGEHAWYGATHAVAVPSRPRRRGSETSSRETFFTPASDRVPHSYRYESADEESATPSRLALTPAAGSARYSSAEEGEEEEDGGSAFSPNQ